MTIWAGDQRHQLQHGGIAFLPRDIPHAVRCDIASRALVLSTPGGSQEGVFRTAGWDLSQPRPDGWQPSPEALHQAAEQNGVTLTGAAARPGRLSASHPLARSAGAARARFPRPQPPQPAPGRERVG